MKTPSQCPACGSRNIVTLGRAEITRRDPIDAFAAQSHYDGEKITTLAESSRCTRCGNQDFKPRIR